MKIVEYFKKNKEKMPGFEDLLMIIGFGMVLHGLHMVYSPLMWIICGVFIVFLGWPKRVVK